MKNTIRLTLLAAVFCFLPCLALAESESELRQFLHSTPNTYGWQPVDGEISYDFFPDGRLHVQGSDGEASMWEGTWKLEGNRLTLKIPDLKINTTFTAGADGADLLLDGQRYRRFAP